MMVFLRNSMKLSELAEPFLNFIKTAKVSNELSSSQKQTVLRLIGKKDIHECFIENWRLISLLNVNSRVILKH